MSTHPEVLWAQRSSATVSEKNIIYLTVNLPDIVPSTLEYALTATNISFKARTKSGGQTEYAFALDLFAEVDTDTEKSTKRLTSRALTVVLRKKESKSEYWPRLTKEKLKTPYIKTDFGKWVDEDEQDGNPAVDDDLDPSGGLPGGFPGGLGSDFDMSKFGDFAGAGAGVGAGASAEGINDVEEESDDEGPPPLEDPEPAK